MYINPIINNNGQIVYFHPVFLSDGDYHQPPEVYVYNRGITKLDDRHTWGYDRNLQLINNGQIAWFERVTAGRGEPMRRKSGWPNRYQLSPQPWNCCF